MISSKHRIVYIHVPKTAGSSVTKTLGGYSGPPLRMHWTAEDYRKAFSREWKTYWRIGGVRCPFSRRLSLHRFFRARLRKAGVDPGPDVDPKHFVTHLKQARKSNCLLWREVNMRQVDYLRGGDLHFLLRYESLTYDWEQMVNELGVGLPLTLPRINVSPGEVNEDEFYTANPDCAEEVRAHDAADFSVFGYDPHRY